MKPYAIEVAPGALGAAAYPCHARQRLVRHEGVGDHAIDAIR
jgi:hypothetical protein